MSAQTIAKKRMIILLAVLVIICCAVAAVFLLPEQEDGSTLASRETILQDVSPGTEWRIASEISIEDYLISSVYAPTKDGVAIFEPQKNGGYAYQGIYYVNKGDIVSAQAHLGQNWYDIFWLDQADLAYAEIIYTIDGRQQSPLRLECTGSSLVYQQAPDDDYTLTIRYYDTAGNIYE